MRGFFRRNGTLAGVLLVLFVWLGGFKLWADTITARPLDEAISLVPAGVVEKDIRLYVARRNRLTLGFRFDGASRSEVRTLVGGFGTDHNGLPREPGTKIPLRWSLKDGSGTVLASGDVETFGSYGFSANEFFRDSGQYVEVGPGSYRFRAEIMRDVPELAQVPTRLYLGVSGNTTSGWQDDLVFAGGIVNMFLLALAVLIILLIGIREVRCHLNAAAQ